MDERDLAYLRTVAAVIGQEIEKLTFIESDLGGARLYACRTAQEDLNAVHTSLKMFINDRTEPGTIIDPVTHIGRKSIDQPRGWAFHDSSTGRKSIGKHIDPTDSASRLKGWD